MRDLQISHKFFEPDYAAYQRQIVLLQIVTMVWMSVEAAVAVFAAVRARSVALLGFGLDSVIELTSAAVVLLRFNSGLHINEKRANRVAGILLFALAVFIVTSSILALTNSRFQPGPSYLGIALLVAASLAMPWLARQKRVLATKTKSCSLNADAVQGSMCAYLAWIALGGLVLNATFKMSWADAVAAMFLTPIVVREGHQALKGEICDCLD